MRAKLAQTSTRALNDKWRVADTPEEHGDAWESKEFQERVGQKSDARAAAQQQTGNHQPSG